MHPSFPKLYSLHYSKVILALELIAYFISLPWRNYYYVFSDCGCCQGDCHVFKEQLSFLKIPHLQTPPTPSSLKQKEHSGKKKKKHSGEKHLCTISTPVHARFNHTWNVMYHLYKGSFTYATWQGQGRE